MLSALVDTGSGYTLIKESTAKGLDREINTRRIVPSLQGVTGKPLRILGAVFLEIGIGQEKVHKQWFPVVPDNYLSTELLLGCDVLGQSPFTCNQQKGLMFWGNAPYVIHKIPKRKGKVERITQIPPPVSTSPPTKNLHILNRVILPPYQTQFVPISVEEPPGTTIIVHPQGKVSRSTHPFCATVESTQTVPCPFANYSKSAKTFKVGTFFGSYEKGEVSSSFVNTTTQITNDLLPKNDLSNASGGRVEKLREVFHQLKLSHLSPTQKTSLSKVIMHHDPLFLLEEGELGQINRPPVKINVADPTPVRGPMYRYPEKAKTIISEMMEGMEKRGIIEKSTSAWLSPIVLVNKPDGTKRMCLDFRKVNTHLATDIYPLPRLDELVEQATGNQYYTTLDLKEAYFQIMLHEDSRDLTAFSDGVSLYRFRRLPFGLSCSPAIFSRQMASLLTPLMKEGWVRNYLDDIILWAPDFPTMLQRLDKVFSCLVDGGVKLNLSKCTFAEAEVKFLGHRVSKNGCKPDPANVEAVNKMKPPQTVKEVRGFLGMCGFYRRHIPDFAKVAAPLTNLTRSKVEFHWSPECESAFQQLKSLLTQAPVLVRADITQPFIVTTDASNTHVGAVLSQIQTDSSNKPIAYFSKKLQAAESRYSATDKEALGVVLACRNFHHYLWGNKFNIVTDHQPLVSVFKRKTKSPRMNRWILEMREYNYNIQYVKGKHNYVADELSRPVRIIQRNPDSPFYLGLTPQEIKDAQREEVKWEELATYLEGGKLPSKRYPKTTLDQFAILDHILYYVKEKSDGSLHYCLVVPQNLKVKAMDHAHLASGHLGQKKSILKAEELFYWCNLKVDVCNYVKECITCQRYKSHPGLQQQWQEMPPVHKPLERLGIDITDMVAGTHNFRYVLTVVDHYSRFVKFFPLKNKNTNTVVEELGRYVADFGAPKAILSDNGGEFVSRQYQDFCRRHHITYYYTTPYNPRGNGITERLHRSLKTILSTLCQGYPLKWPTYLAACQSIMNQAVHTSKGVQPFFAFFSRHAPRVVHSSLPSVDGDKDEIDIAHEIIRDTHLKMSRKYREVANRKRRNQAVSEGSLVWVKREVTQPGTSKKLNPKWEGPFKVVEVIREGSAYLLENLFTGQSVQRTAEKVKPYCGSEEWLTEPRNLESAPEEGEEPIPPRLRRPPRRLIEEC